jgi:hypothetical protein
VEPKVFITYSSKDQKVARTICTALENRGLKCWISARDVKPGQNYQEQIVRAIRTTRIMVLVFTANANNSNEIKKELALASQNNHLVIPVRIEDVAPNEAFAYEFATRQWINVFENWENSISDLADLITATLNDLPPDQRPKTEPGAPAETAAPAPFFTAGPAIQPPPSPMQNSGLRWAMIAGAAVVVAAVVAYATVTLVQRPASTAVATNTGTLPPVAPPLISAPPSMPSSAQPNGVLNISGTYAVTGTNPNGTTYRGSVQIYRDGGSYRFKWLIANAAPYDGIGVLNGNTIVVNWGQTYPAIYQVGANGVLSGTWNNGTATETLVPN